MSKAKDKCLPFFCALKKSFEWTSECQQEDLKAYLSFPLLLKPSKLEEELSLYLAISLASINTTLVRKEDKVQKPMYYTNWALHGAKERYPRMEKLNFALVTAAQKLKLYFQAHIVVILTDNALRQAMSNPEAAGQMAL